MPILKDDNKQYNNQNIQLIIQRIYIKDSSFESPNTPLIFKQQWEPKITIDLNTHYSMLEKNIYEVTLILTVTVKNKNIIAFISEIKQAGIFLINKKIKNKQHLNYILKCYCPNILFPYAREATSSQITKGSFPQLILSPINFDNLYLQNLKNNKNQ
ncbi:protein-export chaperone SecB [Candidatus Legionella polyplacis]|uniref:protein-export chaperone SecB n=1 Tax=Candidatus Legionella polyplacis TaxID=2005262 RepID=UPI000C1F4FFB|nr:protein-export chaperone SecB [Candidatus Legionella polyplacis]ATW02027.1 protein-export chaperone SecB [Candidatus Legionella polyplacis]